MPIMSGAVTVAATSVVDNALQGKTEEFFQRPGRIIIALTAGGSDVYVTLIVGGEIIIDAQLANPATDWPIFPDNVLAEAVGNVGERVVLRLENRNANARDVQFQIQKESIA